MGIYTYVYIELVKSNHNIEVLCMTVIAYLLRCSHPYVRMHTGMKKLHFTEGNTLQSGSFMALD